MRVEHEHTEFPMHSNITHHEITQISAKIPLNI